MIENTEQENREKFDFASKEITLDSISKNKSYTDLTIFDCSGKWKELMPVIAQNKSIGTVVIDWCKLTSADIAPLTTLPKLTVLNLKNNSIGDDGLQLIIKNMPQLVDLNVWNNNITNEGVVNIHKLRNLVKLDIYTNKLKAEGAIHLSKAIQLIELDLGNNRIGNFGATYIAHLTNLKKLNLWNNKITVQGVNKLFRLTQLQELNTDFDFLPDQTKWKLQRFFTRVKFPFNIENFKKLVTENQANTGQQQPQQGLGFRFGNMRAQPQQIIGGNPFNQRPQGTGGLFVPHPPPPSNIFGGRVVQPPVTASALFGQTPQQPPVTAGTLFGSTQPATTGSLFGNIQTATPMGLFGSPAPVASGLFGNTVPVQPAPAPSQPAPQKMDIEEN